MPNGWGVMAGAVARIPKLLYKTAGRVTRDLGAKDPAVAKAALRMVGMHAGAGAVMGGAYGAYTGDGAMRGAVKGGIAGGAFGMVGGTGVFGRAYRQSFRGGVRSDIKRGVGSGQFYNKRNPMVRASRQMAAGQIRSGIRTTPGNSLYSKVNEYMMGGYNPYGGAARASTWNHTSPMAALRGFKMGGGNFGFSANTGSFNWSGASVNVGAGI